MSLLVILHTRYPVISAGNTANQFFFRVAIYYTMSSFELRQGKAYPYTTVKSLRPTLSAVVTGRDLE